MKGSPIAKLENGNFSEYDECCKVKLNNPSLIFLGKGTIYSYNGVRQRDDEEFYFYARK